MCGNILAALRWYNAKRCLVMGILRCLSSILRNVCEVKKREFSKFRAIVVHLLHAAYACYVK